MKYDQLCAIAHNLVDSVASGLGFVIGYYPMDVFGEAAKSAGRSLTIDFLSGRIMNGHGSRDLARAVQLYAEILPEFCGKHGATASEFTELSAVFVANPVRNRVILTVTDQEGRSSRTEYVGVPLERVRYLDPLGRIRRAPRKLSDLKP